MIKLTTKKILPISDLHLETHSYLLNISKEDVDIILLAGDIGNKFQAMKFIEPLLEKGFIVVYVLGNHEFYNINTKIKTMKEIKEGWKERANKFVNLYVLDNNSLIIDDVKIIGTTFWSHINTEDYDVKEVEDINLKQSDLTHIYKSKKLNSGYRILSAKNITVDDYNELHKECVDYLSKELTKPFNGTQILLSHYPLLKESYSKLNDNEKYLSQFYNNDYKELVINSNLDYIIHGHIHESFCYEKNGIKVICNPLGYKKYKEDNKDFNENLILNI